MVKHSFVGLILALLVVTLAGCKAPSIPPADATLPSEPMRPSGSRGGDDSRFPGGSDRLNGEIVDVSGDRLDPLDIDLQDRFAADSAAMLNPGAQDVVESVFFGFDEFNIRSQERDKLARVAGMLQNQPQSRLIAEGHTSWHGTEAYNLALGERRAQAVKGFLVQLGVDANRIATGSMGELEATQDVGRDDPKAVNDRRVDLILVK